MVTQSTLEEVMNSGLYSTEEDRFFSWRGCDVCDDGLGNDVYDAKGYRNLEDARAGNYYEFQVCHECLCKYANGE